jgi:nucleoside phosphorylase
MSWQPGLLEDDGTARRIIKIGTCGGLHRDQPAGSVFVPDCALEDEGASKWNVNDLDDQWEAGIIERLKTTKAADAGLTNKWRRSLESTFASEAATVNSGSCVEDPLSWWSGSRKREGTGKVRSSCVWTIDTFHARRVHANRIFDLVERHMREQTEPSS